MASILTDLVLRTPNVEIKTKIAVTLNTTTVTVIGTETVAGLTGTTRTNAGIETTIEIETEETVIEMVATREIETETGIATVHPETTAATETGKAIVVEMTQEIVMNVVKSEDAKTQMKRSQMASVAKRILKALLVTQGVRRGTVRRILTRGDVTEIDTVTQNVIALSVETEDLGMWISH